MALVGFVAMVLTILSMDLRISQATSRFTLDKPSSTADYFQQWMIKFSKVYANESEKQMRFEIFKKNLKYIEDFNSKGNQSYTLGVNEFTDLTHEEFFETYTGHLEGINITSPSEVANETIASPNWNISNGYDYVDWRPRGAVTPVRQQAGCEACWAFSAIAAVEGLTKIARGTLIKLSEQQLIDCDRDFNRGCNGGNMARAFKYIVQNGGIASKDEYPYLFQEGSCQYDARPSMQLKGYKYVPQNNEVALMEAVRRQPVSVAIAGNTSDFKDYAGGVFNIRECGLTVTHGVTLVGFGTSPEGVDYWIAKNSWGKYWGERGYMRIRRNVEWPEGMCGLAKFASYPIA